MKVSHYSFDRQPLSPRRQHPRGQSLLEFAFTSSILILLLTGIVDLGRAFFAAITLNNMVSEGAHWAAAYPNCVLSGASTVSANPKCKGTNSIVGRMLNENTTLDRVRFRDMRVEPVSGADWTSASWANGIPAKGVTVRFAISYDMPTIMPLSRLIFGNTIAVSAEVREVVRGKDDPPSNGTDMTPADLTSKPEDPPDVRQINPTDPNPNPPQASGFCSGTGLTATINWNPVFSSGYRITRPDNSTFDITPGTLGSTTVQLAAYDTNYTFKVASFRDADNNPTTSGDIKYSTATNVTVRCNTPVWPALVLSAPVCGSNLLTMAFTKGPEPLPQADAQYVLLKNGVVDWTTRTVGSPVSYVMVSGDNTTTQYQVQFAAAASNTLLGNPSAAITTACSYQNTPVQVANFQWINNQTCTNGVATFSWNPTAGATEYILKNQTVGTSSSIGMVTTTTVTLVPGAAPIVYAVAAKNAAGEGAPSLGVSASCQVVQAPSNFGHACGAYSGGNFSVTYTWTDISGAGRDTRIAKYRIRRGSTTLFTSATLPSPMTFTESMPSANNNQDVWLEILDSTNNVLGTAIKTTPNCTAPFSVVTFSCVPGSPDSTINFTWSPMASSTSPVTVKKGTTTMGTFTSGTTGSISDQKKQVVGSTYRLTMGSQTADVKITSCP